MQEYTQKYAVACFFDDLQEGYTFHYSDTPLHVTLAQVFAFLASSESIISIVDETVKGFGGFTLLATGIENWGDITVTRFEFSERLDFLYRTIQQKLLDGGAVFNEPEHLLDGFKTHSTHQKSGHIGVDEHVDIKSVSLIDMYPDEDSEKRQIVKVWSLR